MAVFQWLALAALVLIIGAFAFAYVRHGAKVRPDTTRRHEDGMDAALGSNASGFVSEGDSGTGND